MTKLIFLFISWSGFTDLSLKWDFKETTWCSYSAPTAGFAATLQGAGSLLNAEKNNSISYWRGCSGFARTLRGAPMLQAASRHALRSRRAAIRLEGSNWESCCFGQLLCPSRRASLRRWRGACYAEIVTSSSRYPGRSDPLPPLSCRDVPWEKEEDSLLTELLSPQWNTSSES